MIVIYALVSFMHDIVMQFPAIISLLPSQRRRDVGLEVWD